MLFSERIISLSKENNIKELERLIKLHELSEEDVILDIVKSGNLSILKHFVENLNYPIHFNNGQPLFFAITYNYLDIVRYLIEEKNLSYDMFKSIYLEGAISYGSIELVKYFIEKHNCDPHAYNAKSLKVAISSKKIDIVKYLVEEHNCITENNKLEILKTAIKVGDFDVIKYLVEGGYITPSEDPEILITAIENCDFNIIKYLIEECGCDPCIKEEILLYFGAVNERWDVIFYLLDNFNLNTLSIISQVEKNLLLEAAEQKNKKILEKLIEKYGFLPKVVEKDLMKITIKLGDIETMNYLITKHGCDLTEATKEICFSSVNADVIPYIIAHGGWNNYFQEIVNENFIRKNKKYIKNETFILNIYTNTKNKSIKEFFRKKIEENIANINKRFLSEL